MALKTSYPSFAAAEADVLAAGFKQSDKFPEFYTKPGMTHGWEPHPTVALVAISEQRVDPQWGQPNYFTVDFR